MAEVRLQSPGVGPSVSESIASRVPEHMGMRLDPEAGRLPGPFNHPPEA
jgi:hypothetical protein